MRKAEEVAEGLAYDFALFWCKEQHQKCEKADEMIPIVKEALESYAAEALDKAWIAYAQQISQAQIKARKEALEEAAKLILPQHNHAESVRVTEWAKGYHAAEHELKDKIRAMAERKENG